MNATPHFGSPVQQDPEQIVPDAAAPADELSTVGSDPDRIQDYLGKLTH